MTAYWTLWNFFMPLIRPLKFIFLKICVSILLILSACAPKPTFNGVDITGADYANGFSFKDQQGRSLSMDSFKGKVVALFFGYTQCPDVCPTTMSELKQIKESLAQEGDKLQVLFVSVDPKRDTPEVLKAYVSNFDSSFIGYSPAPEDLDQIAKSFKIYYKKVPSSSDPNSYTVDHSAGTYLFDTQGRIRLFIRYAMPNQALTQDIKSLMAEVK